MATRDAAVLGIVATLVGTVSSRVLAETCVSGSTVKVCVAWESAGEPQQDQHFIVDFTDASNPDLELREGDDWTIYAELVSNGNLANFGDVTTTDAENYSVKISRTGGAGAVNVGSLVLEPSGDHYALIESVSRITGNLNGNLILQSTSGGSGGTAFGFTIEGNVTGDIEMRRGESFTIEGDVVGNITMERGEGFTIGGTYGATGGAHETLEVDTIELLQSEAPGDLVIHSLIDVTVRVNDNVSQGGRLRVEEDATDSIVWVQALAPGSSVDIGYTQSPGSAYVTDTEIYVGNGIPSQAALNLENARMTGTILLGTFADLDGTFLVYEYSGTMVGLNLDGTMSVADDISGGSIHWYGNVNGTLEAGGSLSADVSIDGDLRPLGSIEIGGSLALGRDIEIGGGMDSLSGIDIGGDVSGDIHVTEDTATLSRIDIAGRLGRGRLLVDGICYAEVTVAEDTGSASLIHLLGGLGNGGRITINAGEGNHNAGGNILVGPDSVPLELDPITYDGCIEVLDNGSGGYGDLDGDVTVVGCHVTTDDVGLTIEGDKNGDVTIVQTDCENQVDWSACP